ncbi:hypothetical protein SKAU_G00235520 [Synaphobranchus kaupii]|uniref:C2H2-type domain-containing protein n=1 Tax=Synaphobranchus kaupii TaxID=118154 RepID=A0A9Q1ITT2_SYNKA|nr:hypothetical protein SKAU_G00235520 [Synaphobranchus kaupii]
MGSTAKQTPTHRAHTMTGETRHARAIKESDNASKQQEKGSLPERFSVKLKQESAERYKCGGLDPQALSRTKECTQREAVIRPQQAGKIDFKSLQNRPKFSSDRTWHSGKGSPQSPNGKSRTRDKSKRSGKAERGNPQQLYRLSISNPRANPTIGIAYPQQKVTPPKKLEASRGAISGSYRFHVPSIPEREAELQQEELSFNRCFQEASSNLTSTNYTSQADSATGGTPAHQHPGPPQQQPSLRDNNNSQPSSQLLFPEFPVNRAASWQSPDKSFNGAIYGASSQKLPIFPEGEKVNSSLVPLQFQYGYPSLQDAEVDLFPCDQNNRPQDYLDIALATAQVTHSSFTFHASGEGQEDTQTDSQFSNKQPEGRSSYGQLPQHAQYLQSQHEAQPSLHCHKGRSKHLINSENSVSGLHKIDQGKNTVPDNPGPFNQVDGEGAALISVEKQSCPPSIESTANQRILTQGNAHHVRNIAQGQSSQMLSPSKVYSSSSVSTIHVGSVPLEESLPGGSSKIQSRLLETWDGANKTFSSMDHNSALYSNLNDKCQFQCQPTGEQRQPSSNNRMAWQQIQLTSAMPKQNRIQLSRQLSNQKLTFPIGAFDWQESKKPHKNSPLNSFHNKRPNEAFTNRRPESIKEQNSNISTFPFEHRVESVSSTVCDARKKHVYFEVSQSLPGPYSKPNSHAPSQVPTASYESPLPSPLQNPSSTSPCSSVSPASHSPVNISPEDSQVLMAGPPPPLYHQNQEKTLMPLDHINSNLHHFHTDLSRTFPNTPERHKEDMLSYMHNNKCSNPIMDGAKSCLNSYGVEHPPPPYSAHQLLASSLAAANLDQLDVLLTCKQCDQNFNNLASFLDHKQYCGQHMSTQNNILKSVAKMEEHRKYQTDCTKTSSSGMGFPLSRCPSDPHLSLLGLSKNGELISDSETKADTRDEPLKLNFFSGTNNLPVTLPDLEMDDAKLDSLITEALNGLGYQSDNAEIDSSFIDAFVDDDLTTNLNLKTKDFVMVNSRNKHEATTDQISQTQGKNLCDSDRDSMSAESKRLSSIPEKTHQDFKQEDKANSKEVTPHKKARGSSSEKSTEEKEWKKEVLKTTDKTGEKNKIDSRFLLSRKFSERCKLKSFQERSSLIMPPLSHASSANWSTAAPRATVKEGKRRKAGGGTWSKELIHKIVQQKNKPPKLHVKGTKNLQFSLVTERLTPEVQSPKFGEYDYVSDSDEESEPLRLTSHGRLGHAGRCKYTYSREYKGKYTYSRDKGRDWADKGGSVLWKHQLKDSGEAKVAEQISPSPVKESSIQRMRRRSSRSSSSSELSEPASVSSESITSPKTADRTDSESERMLTVRRMSSNNVQLSESFEQDNCKRSVQDIPKEPTTPTTLTTPTVLSSHPFSKNTRRYGSAKFLLSHDKGPLPSSRVVSLRDRGSESRAELPQTSGFRSHGEDYGTEQEREKEHSAAVSMKERAEEPSPVKRSDRMGNASFTGTPVDFQTPGAQSKLIVAEENSEDPEESDTLERSTVCDVSNEGGTEDFKKENSPVCWDLLPSSGIEEVQSIAIKEEAHKATALRCSTPDNAATDSVAEVSHERTTNSPYVVDQERTAEILYQENQERTTDCQVHQEKKTDMPCQVDQEKTTDMPVQVDQDRTMDAVSQINQERTTGTPCKVNPEWTLDVICQTNQVDQERTPGVCCSLLSTEAEAKSNEKSELTLGEHVSTLPKEPFELTSLEEETVAEPKCAPTPTQDLSALSMLPLHDMSTSNAVETKENIAGAIPQPGLSSLSSSPSHSEDHSRVQQGQSPTIWAHFDRRSPDSVPHRQSPRRDEQNSSEMHLCDPPVSMMSEMPNEMTSVLPDMDIGINENKRSGHDSDSITSDLPLINELLSILKTDILQAIAPDFSATPHESSCSPEKQDKINTTECLEVRAPERFPFKLIDSAGEKDVITGHTEQHNAHKQGLAVDPIEAEMEEEKGFEPKLFGCDRTTGSTICSKFEEPGEHVDDLKETCEQKDVCVEDSICTETLAEVSFEVKCEKATCITDRVGPKSCSFKSASTYSPGPDPDLEALLDDERTFSQLFPRDEEMIRKKCARVYGKKNKKQNSDSNLQSCPVDSISSDKKAQHSESHDDQILINKMRDHSPSLVPGEQLRDHLREKHAKNKAGIWACGMCLKEISDVWMYNEHLREHATQFARKGQTQSSLLGMPGCFMQETAVKNFIHLHHAAPVQQEQQRRDAQELKDHLKNEHEEIEEPDSKHTTLYTCELCADVMHVIKKSFICSTCNYTFSKKEQF